MEVVVVVLVVVLFAPLALSAAVAEVGKADGVVEK